MHRAYATAHRLSDAPHASPPPDRSPPLEPLELGYKSQLTSSNPQPVRRRRWWHSTTPRQAEREGRGRSKEEEGSRYRTGPRQSQERCPDRLQRRSCSTWHCIASSRPCLATAPPSYHHEPYGEPRRSPLTALAVLAMNATAFLHLGDTEAEHSHSWTRYTRTTCAQAQGLASPTPSGSGTPARPPCMPWPRAQPWQDHRVFYVAVMAKLTPRLAPS